jgi:hypothetical protein
MFSVTYKTNFRRVRINIKKPLWASSCLSACLSVDMHQRGSHRTDFRKIWYWGLVRRSIEKLQKWLKSDKHIGHFTWRPMQACIADSSTKYTELTQQEWKGSPLLRFHGNTERFYTVDGHKQFNWTKGTHCCVSIVTMVMWTRHNLTLYVNCLTCFIRISAIWDSCFWEVWKHRKPQQAVSKRFLSIMSLKAKDVEVLRQTRWLLLGGKYIHP